MSKGRCGRCSDVKTLATEGPYKAMLCEDCALDKKYEAMAEQNELDYELLESYADGPRIWDAASIVPRVFDLAEAGLISPTDQSGYRYEITEAGRKVLAER